MRVRIIKSFASAQWSVNENQILDVTEEFAGELIREGIAEPFTRDVETMSLRHGRTGPQAKVKKHAPTS